MKNWILKHWQKIILFLTIPCAIFLFSQSAFAYDWTSPNITWEYGSGWVYNYSPSQDVVIKNINYTPPSSGWWCGSDTSWGIKIHDNTSSTELDTWSNTSTWTPAINPYEWYTYTCGAGSSNKDMTPYGTITLYASHSYNIANYNGHEEFPTYLQGDYLTPPDPTVSIDVSTSTLSTDENAMSDITGTSTLFYNSNTRPYTRYLKIPVTFSISTSTYMQASVNVKPLGFDTYNNQYISLQGVHFFALGVSTTTEYVLVPFNSLSVNTEYQVSAQLDIIATDTQTILNTYSSTTTDYRFFQVPSSTISYIASTTNPYTGQYTQPVIGDTNASSSPYYVDCSAYSASSLFSDTALDAISCYFQKGILSVGRFLFEPHQSFQDALQGAEYDLESKFPFNVVFNLNDTLSTVINETASSTASSTLALVNYPIGSHSITLTFLSSTTLSDVVGEPLKNQLFAWASMLIWIAVGYLMYIRIF